MKDNIIKFNIINIINKYNLNQKIYHEVKI